MGSGVCEVVTVKSSTEGKRAPVTPVKDLRKKNGT